jgi:hypothetical protein
MLLHPKAAIPLSAQTGRLAAVVEGPTWGRKRPSRRATKRQISTTGAMLPYLLYCPIASVFAGAYIDNTFGSFYFCSTFNNAFSIFYRIKLTKLFPQ